MNYQSVFNEIKYLPQRVVIEIGARSSAEPYEKRKIKSIIDENYPDLEIAESSFEINVIRLKKHFWKNSFYYTKNLVNRLKKFDISECPDICMI